MSMAPEGAVSPMAQAPPDRPTLDLEQWARQGIALIFGDRMFDPNEQQILRGFLEELSMRAQAAGGMGQGGTPSLEPTGEPPQNPMELNANTEDFGAGQGEPTGEEY